MLFHILKHHALLSVKKAGSYLASMESQTMTSEQLDTEFDKILVDMKPYVLKLPEKKDRQRCAVWIKKLCEPPSSGLSSRKNRNLYSQLMLRMLRRGTLESPFDLKPEDGSLPTLPTYMDKTPDWVSGELTHSVGSSLFHRSAFWEPTATSTFLTSRDIKQRSTNSLGVSSLDSHHHLSLPNRDEQSLPFALDDLCLDTKSSPTHSPLNREQRKFDVRPRSKSPTRRNNPQVNDSDWSRPYSHHSHVTSTLYPKVTPYPDEQFSLHTSEIETRIKMLEANFHEEKVRLKQKHDNYVQKVIERKNLEVEDLKSEYNEKVQELEDVVAKLDKKVQSVVKESNMVRESKEKQVSELKKMVEDTDQSKKLQYEKKEETKACLKEKSKLHDLLHEFEQEKFEMQNHHSRNVQEVLEETDVKLRRMEKEYGQQTTSTSNIIKELENRVQMLTTEVDNTVKQRVIIEKEKNELQIKVDRLSANLEDSKDRFRHLDSEYKHLIDTHKQEVRSLKSKTEASLQYIKQEQSLSSSKNTEAISELEQQVEQLKKALKDTEESNHRQLREQEHTYQQDKMHLESLHDKQIRSLKKEYEQSEQLSEKKIKRLENTLHDKEQELNRLREQNHEQAAQADRALEEFKLQVEKNQTRMHDEMKEQMNKVQSDLHKSKLSREKQAQEFAHQLEEEKFQHDKELAEIKIFFDNDKTQLLRDFHIQKDYILSDHEKDLDNIKEAHKAELNCLEMKSRERQEKDNKTMRELETQLRELREELVQSNQLRKQQLVELGLLREEEKQKMQRDHELEITRMRTDSEQQRLELQKTHSFEMEQMLQKTSGRLKDLEKENDEKMKNFIENISSLQTTIDHLRTENKRIKEKGDKKVIDIDVQHEDEKKAIRKQYSNSMQKISQELDVQRKKVRNLERQLQKEESDYEEKVTRLKLNYEERIRGLIPTEVRQELEDTIEALKSQVYSLQQRASVLQDEVDTSSKPKFSKIANVPIKAI
ncbi:centrosomal protein of 112 kDa isoform X3 [Patella vulgata]|uniref:centrosomal protein of 112 kDa isoform X3 n=1 Tax=Patella vulgata TaxID=6465 RepID=UPI0024A93C76|nr:centrosomal protein of 112 kDa isoform X3 [Patella vulgata]